MAPVVDREASGDETGVKVGALAAFSPLQTVLTVLVLTSLVARFGVEALAGYGIGARLEFLLVPITFAVEQTSLYAALEDTKARLILLEQSLSQPLLPCSMLLGVGMLREEIPYPREGDSGGFMSSKQPGQHFVTHLLVTHPLARLLVSCG